MKYIPSPDYSPQALEEVEPHQKQFLLDQMQEEQCTGIIQEGYFTIDMQANAIEKMKFKEFVEYRNQFELSQQTRIQTILQQLKEAKERGKSTKKILEDQDKEFATALGIPFLKCDLMDPRQIRHEIQEDKARKRGKKLGEDLKLKLCDLGNGCWTYHQFSSEI